MESGCASGARSGAREPARIIVRFWRPTTRGRRLAESPVSAKDSKATKDVRLGLVGAGAIAQLAHLPVLSKIKGAQLIALCDNDGPKASASAERLKIPDTFTGIEHLLELDWVDWGGIVWPNQL